MERPYLIFVDGKLAERRLTGTKALRRVRELQDKGYNNVTLTIERKIK